MKLLGYLKYHSPLSTKPEITACINYLRCYNAYIDSAMEKLLYSNTPAELHEHLKTVIESYQKEYMIRREEKPSIVIERHKAKSDKKKKEGLSEEDFRKLNMFLLRKNKNGKNLSDLGYEHGLSDW
jgi:hypothetical protein